MLVSIGVGRWGRRFAVVILYIDGSPPSHICKLIAGLSAFLK